MKYKKINPSNLTIKETYHLLISGVSPRPIALVSSIDNNGICNLAPFSFFNAFGANPPILGFSPALSGKTGMPKDTLLNIRDTKEFSVSIVNSNIVEQVSLASCEYKRDIDEFDHYFDHILVVDHNKSGKIHDKVVGTYRLNGGNYKNKKDPTIRGSFIRIF